ncbi:glycoside hydrolase family 13 protein [Echinimonas agarilytica]|uniref:Glycoside hydrolase family 13 protein n=1 Tax=Echinimonas agarilytica TaxID=1215918 RepID=A0AA41W408_9GAMM|nr:glycoside hydrolase family 13 protein [Echinimonas agarilytica]MCM2678426.1 glycoside hydrolase family 13 protein [Echinimonas agarilytica]
MVNTPDWVKHAVFYQIFPDRFARQGGAHLPLGISLKPWGSCPGEQGFQGGDLLGVCERLDYLQNLGINAIYLNPIFSSACNHRYHTYDYFAVDPLLGGDQALRQLLDEAHARDMKVILDGVFNHASRGFWAFHHILENGTDSPYIDWFEIEDWPLRPYHSDDDNPPNYKAWWGLPALPKFNINNTGVRQYIFSVAEYWLEFGIDGWRLDVPGEIDDDLFWREFRQRVKAINPEAYICGEIWERATHWLQGDMFDATMNYEFCSLALSYFGHHSLRTDYKKNALPLEPLTTEEFIEGVGNMLGAMPKDINDVQFNLLGSHDMARPLWIVHEDISALQQAMLFQMTMPGAPCLYYGDEISMTGEDDPHCRGAYPWHQPDLADKRMLAYVREIIHLRHQVPALRTGEVEFDTDLPPEVLGYQRTLDDQQVQVLINRGSEAQTIRLADAEQWTLLFGGAERLLPHGRELWVNLPARHQVVLLRTTPPMSLAKAV